VKTITLTTVDKEVAVFELTNKANAAAIRKLDSKTKQPLANAAVKVTDAGGKVFYEGNIPTTSAFGQYGNTRDCMRRKCQLARN